MPAHTWPLLYADAPATFAPCTLTPTEVPLLVRVTCTPTGDVLANDGTTTPTTAAALTPRMTRRRLTIGPSRTGGGSAAAWRAHFDGHQTIPAAGSAAVPTGPAHVHPGAGDRHSFVTQQVELSVSLVRGAGPVVVQHSMPRHLRAVPRHHRPNGAGGPGTYELRDVAVRHHLAPRNALDRVEDQAGKGSHTRTLTFGACASLSSVGRPSSVAASCLRRWRAVTPSRCSTAARPTRERSPKPSTRPVTATATCLCYRAAAGTRLSTSAHTCRHKCARCSGRWAT